MVTKAKEAPLEPSINDFINIINKFQSHDVWTAYSDFMSIAALNIVDVMEQRCNINVKEEMLQTYKKYNVKEQMFFPKLLSIFIYLMDKAVNSGKMDDIAGTIFHNLDLGSKQTGQFFTPQHIAEAMVNAQFDINYVKKTINDKGFVYISEPSCGAGVNVLGFATAMMSNQLNPQTQLFVETTDIDKRCVNMCYVQLTYYGIPAIVTHGDAITNKVWNKLKTPAYYLNSWRFRRC